MNKIIQTNVKKNEIKKESKKKSIFKTFSWRIIAMTISYIVAYFFTSSHSISFWLVITANILSMIVYYFHERAWSFYH